tara:strand:+ start:468 stop:725 length:258 start_codon:yes stop_codon:yes gene_type:complete
MFNKIYVSFLAMGFLSFLTIGLTHGYLLFNNVGYIALGDVVVMVVNGFASGCCLCLWIFHDFAEPRRVSASWKEPHPNTYLGERN